MRFDEQPAQMRLQRDPPTPSIPRLPNWREGRERERDETRKACLLIKRRPPWLFDLPPPACDSVAVGLPQVLRKRIIRCHLHGPSEKPAWSCVNLLYICSEHTTIPLFIETWMSPDILIIGTKPNNVLLDCEVQRSHHKSVNEVMSKNFLRRQQSLTF